MQSKSSFRSGKVLKLNMTKNCFSKMWIQLIQFGDWSFSLISHPKHFTTQYLPDGGKNIILLCSISFSVTCFPLQLKALGELCWHFLDTCGGSNKRKISHLVWYWFGQDVQISDCIDCYFGLEECSISSVVAFAFVGNLTSCSSCLSALLKDDE